MSRAWDLQAAEFDRQNPVVYETLKALALEAHRAGKRRLGIGALWERMRWELSLNTTESEPALNNNYRAYFSRRLMAEVPALAGIFVTRGTASSGIADGLATTLPDTQPQTRPSPYAADDEYEPRRAA